MVKIIDDKGRLFGKINVIDFLALVFLIALIPMFYSGYKIFNHKVPAIIPVIEKIEKSEYDKLLSNYNKLSSDYDNINLDYRKLQEEYVSIGDKYKRVNDKVNLYLKSHKRAKGYF